MRKVISILLVLVICLSMAVTAFANDDFVKSPGESGTPGADSGSDVPKTGDNSNMFLWVSMMVVSAVALASVVGLRRKAV